MKTIKGNLITLAKEGQFDLIVHGCNCQGVMGAGIAKQIKDNFPEAYNVDRTLYTELYLSSIDQQVKLGRYTLAFNEQYNVTIVNGYTQIQPGPNAIYLAVKTLFETISLLVDPSVRIGVPQIGCGIGGLEWDVVEGIISRIMSNHDVTAVIYQP